MPHTPQTWKMVLALVDHQQPVLTPGLLSRRFGWSMQTSSQVLNDMTNAHVLKHESHPSYGLVFIPVMSAHTRHEMVLYNPSNAIIKAHDPQHNHVLSAVLSALFPGLGQVYNGQIGKGLGIFFSTIFLWLLMLGWSIHLWSIFDAYHTGKRIKYGDRSPY